MRRALATLALCAALVGCAAGACGDVYEAPCAEGAPEAPAACGCTSTIPVPDIPCEAVWALAALGALALLLLIAVLLRTPLGVTILLALIGGGVAALVLL